MNYLNFEAFFEGVDFVEGSASELAAALAAQKGPFPMKHSVVLDGTFCPACIRTVDLSREVTAVRTCSSA